jgi:homoserine kinase
MSKQNFKIRVPATTANLGSGFDCMGIALNLYNYFEVSISDNNKIYWFGSEKTEWLPRSEQNLIHQSIRKVFEYANKELIYTDIKSEINIPVSRGLGSSSSAIIAGVFIGNQLLGNTLTNNELINIANEIEGHPDNITPCLFGGITSSIVDNKKVHINKINNNSSLKFIFLIPEFQLSTKEARKVLPSNVSFSDAVFNLSRVSFLVEGFSKNNPELIKLGLQDKLHEQYRSKLIKGFYELREKAIELGALNLVISGAGPTLLIITENNEKEIAESLKFQWKEMGINSYYHLLNIDTEGAKII